MNRLSILHRIVDLYSGGAEVVMKNFIDAFPEWQHSIVFDNYYDTWLARALEQKENVRLFHTEATRFSAVLAAEAPDVTLYHWYPSMNSREIETTVAESSSKAVLYSHYFRQVPVIDDLHYWFVAPSARSSTGGQLPAERCRVIINPVADAFFRIDRRPVEPVIGRHSSGRHLKFPPRFFELHEALSASRLQIRVMGYSHWLLEQYRLRESSLTQHYTLLPLNSLPVDEFLGGVSVFVYNTDPRITETCPMVILEAMAAARPIVTENRGGIVDLITDGHSGWLCDNEAALVEKIDWCLNEPDAAIRLGMQAREWACRNASIGGYRDRVLSALAAL